MHQPWRKLGPNCTSVTTLATIAAGTGAGTSTFLTLSSNPNVYMPVPPNSAFSIASQAIPLTASTRYISEYTCTQ
jgi:hypothetical protein